MVHFCHFAELKRRKITLPGEKKTASQMTETEKRTETTYNLIYH